MTENDMPSMESLAPLIDRLREIADEEVPHPQTLEVRVWDDGDYSIRIFHKYGPKAMEQIVYHSRSGEAVWQRLKGPSSKQADGPDGYEGAIEMEYDEREERRVDLDHSK
jgi:hypothetical protein